VSETPVAAPAPSGFTWFAEWIRRHPWDLVPIVGLIVSCVTYIIVAFATAGFRGLGPFFVNSFSYLWVIAWMLVITFVVRTIGVREVLVTFFGGFFTSVAIVHLISVPIIGMTGVNPFISVYLVPTLEELSKVIPLLLLLLAYRRRRGERSGISDLVVAGFAAGAGVGLHEDLMYGRSVTSSNGTLFGTFDGVLGGLFPNFFVGGGTTLVAHAGWGTIIGLGVGVSALLWYRLKFFALIPGALGVLVAIIDHSTWNDSNDFWGRILTADHQVAVAVTVLAIPAAVVTDFLLRRRHTGELPFPSLRIYPFLVRRGGGVVEVVLSIVAYGHYRRGWNAQAYGAARGMAIDGVSPRLDAWLKVAFPPAEPTTFLPRKSGKGSAGVAGAAPQE
jgi:protease prsW family protein